MPDEPATTAEPAEAAARAATAAQMPSIVRRALLPRPVKIHGIELQFTFDLMLVLQEVGNPLCTPGAMNVGEDAPPFTLSNLHVAQIVFAMANAAEAVELATLPSEDGAKWTPFEQAALKWIGARKITPSQMRDLSTACGTLYAEELAAAPGAGTENPREGTA